ncbi:family 2 encapsulin nanocompartment cargo protein terpene cyclase [Pseudomonas sp. W2Aug9]|uniref:family 2 encapsulin nanocompartment cargo protein terpene cyclase n=1 Tax=Pseudomonas sp. W2Aug9 TaxID=1215242 RepID=UPI002003D930|nr:family 2 encapsulin nanocompartment cargo protein terpene cyclase [Pseudomonas sp. W2Aug9]MCK3826345.1 Camphene synthase [Pseudomonas sp. W2Aug9]
MNDISPPPPPQKNSTGLEIPALECPLPIRLDEALGNRINALLMAWINRIGIFEGQLDHVRASNFGRFVMLCHADTDDVQRLLLSAKCMAALFAVDDHYCDDERSGANPKLLGARLSLALAALDRAYLIPSHDLALKRALNDDPVLRGLRGYMNHLDRYATPSQKARVQSETIAMFVTMNAEASWRIEHSLPQVWEYLAHRQINSFLPCMALIDIVGGYELGADTYFSAPVREVIALAASLTMLVNDLYSASKEQEPGIGDFNLPLLLANEQGCSLQQALWLTADLHNTLIRRYEAKERRLLKQASPTLKRFLGGVKAWLGGNYEWHRHSGRYQV